LFELDPYNQYSWINRTNVRQDQQNRQDWTRTSGQTELESVIRTGKNQQDRQDRRDLTGSTYIITYVNMTKRTVRSIKIQVNSQDYTGPIGQMELKGKIEPTLLYETKIPTGLYRTKIPTRLYLAKTIDGIIAILTQFHNRICTFL
jgi:hypothetical protein